MTFLHHIPPVVRVAAVFALVLFLMRKKLSLGNAFAVGALSLAALFAMSPTEIAISVVGAALEAKTVSLVVVIGLILMFSSSLEVAGQMQRLLAGFRGLISSPRLELILFPALIGLLPMPGGAVFSAPMVKELGARTNLPADKLSLVNYWFRHLWEYWWPLYPCALLAVALAEVDLWSFVLMTCPVTLVAVGVGYWSLRDLQLPAEHGPGPDGRDDVDTEPSLGPFLAEIMPIALVIVLGPVLGVTVSFAFQGLAISRELGLIVTLCVSIAWVWRKNAFGRGQVRKVVGDRRVFEMAYLIVSVLVFKGILQDSKAVQAIAEDMMAYRIPLMLMAVSLPFLVGVITGFAVAFVGIAIPILMPLIQAVGESGHLLPYVMLIVVCGMCGVLVSPVHFCFILSNQYFGVPMRAVYRYLWPLCVAIAGWGVGWFFLLSA